MKNVPNYSDLTPQLAGIFRKYRIISSEDGKPECYTQVDLIKVRDGNQKALGMGPLLGTDVVGKFLEADSTPEKKWLDWMFNRAGGGPDAERRSAQAMEQIREHFIDERVRGFRDSQNEFHAGVPKEDAEAQWVDADPRFRSVVMVGDQDMVEKLAVFGYYRHWPGKDKIYERICTAVSSFIGHPERIAEMNQYYSGAGMADRVVKCEAEDYPNVDALETVNKKIDRFFAAKAARVDIRAEKVYEDEHISVVCPLTYAASVHYGWDGWPASSKEMFEQMLESNQQSWQDQWKTVTGKDKKFFVFLTFQRPMPCWVAYSQKLKRFTRYSMQNLMIQLSREKANDTALNQITLVNEEGAVMSMADAEKMLIAEVTRDEDPANEEHPIVRGPRVVRSEAEAESVKMILVNTINRIADWRKTFDASAVVSDYLPE